MATFGYSDNPVVEADASTNIVWFKAQSTPASNGSLTSITLLQSASYSAGQTMFVALYSDDGGSPSKPHTLLASIATGGGSLSNVSYGTTTSNISYASLVAGTQYWFGIACSSWSAYLGWYFNISGTDINFATNDCYYGGTDTSWPATAESNLTFYNECGGAYATYTPSAGGATWLKEGYLWQPQGQGGGNPCF
jgi:hypothetical protein